MKRVTGIGGISFKAENSAKGIASISASRSPIENRKQNLGGEGFEPPTLSV